MNQGLRASSFSFAGLVTCVGISVLLISPALAQVNGPGESPANLFDTVLNLPGDEAVITGINLESIGGVPGQTIQLNLTDGGAIGNFFDARLGGEVNISGGMIGFNIDADPGSELNISGGSFDGLIVLDEGVANISGGNLGGPIIAESGSTVDISGGVIGFVGSVSRFFGSFTAEPGSAVNISGGTFNDFEAADGAAVAISGGTFTREFEAGADVELIGGDFRLNGADFSGSTISLTNNNDVFTGTLADGSTFIFAAGAGASGQLFRPNDNFLSNVNLTVVPLPQVDLSPMVVTNPISSGLTGLRPGQTLTLAEGGELPRSFEVVDATLNVVDGILDDSAEVSGGEMNISGGTVGRFFDAYAGTEVNISGGSVGSFFNAFAGSVVNITGGTVGNFFEAFTGSEVNISGGDVGSDFLALGGSEVNISGGSFGESFSVSSDSVVNVSGGTFGDGFSVGGEANISGGTFGFVSVANDGVFNLFGSDFAIDGVPVAGLTIDEAFTITDPFAILSGQLADGSAFSFILNPRFFELFTFEPTGDDFFSPDATVTVTLVSPEVLEDGLLGDVNQDGAVDFEDIAPFITLLMNGGLQFEADIDGDGDVDFEDIAPFIALLSGQ